MRRQCGRGEGFVVASALRNHTIIDDDNHNNDDGTKQDFLKISCAKRKVARFLVGLCVCISRSNNFRAVLGNGKIED